MSGVSVSGERRYDREQFEREVQEALRAAGAHKLPAAPPPRRPTASRLDLRPSSPGMVMLAGLALIVLEWLGLAFFLGGFAGMLGLALLGFGLLTWLVRPRRRETYWRGRKIEWDENPGWLERVYYLVYRR